MGLQAKNRRIPEITYADMSRTVRLDAQSPHGFVHAFCHCSARIDAESLLVTPGEPLVLTAVSEACTAVLVNGPLSNGVRGAVRIYREIYQMRPDARSIVRGIAVAVV